MVVKSEEPTGQEARKRARLTVKPVRNHIKILVVDDDPSVCETVAALLERNGFQVQTMGDPQAATELAIQESFHLILVDLKMPEMDGIKVVSRIKEVDHRVGCIIMTAYPDMETAAAAMRAGCCDYITKPFKQDELLQAVDRACKAMGLIYTDEGELNRLIGERIRRARLSQTMTLRQLSELTQLTTSQLSQVELGKNAASVWALARVSGALGYQMSKLLQGV